MESWSFFHDEMAKLVIDNVQIEVDRRRNDFPIFTMFFFFGFFGSLVFFFIIVPWNDEWTGLTFLIGEPE